MDEQSITILLEIKAAIGRLESSVESNHGYIKAVSENQKKTAIDLNIHEKDIDAHGGGTSHRLWGVAVALAGITGPIIWELIKRNK